MSAYPNHEDDLKHAHHSQHNQQSQSYVYQQEEMVDNQPMEQAESPVPVDNVSVWAVICSRELRTPLIIAIVMQLSQQLSGINAILYYSTDIYKATGLGLDQATWATIGVGGVMVIMTLVSIPLMDKMGRRTLHLWGE